MGSKVSCGCGNRGIPNPDVQDLVYQMSKVYQKHILFAIMDMRTKGACWHNYLLSLRPLLFGAIVLIRMKYELKQTMKFTI